MTLHPHKILLLISLIFFSIAPSVSVRAKEINSINLIVTDANFTSDLAYWGRHITSFVKNYAGELEVKIINEGTKASPISELTADIKYVYAQPGSSPVIYPTGFKKGSLHLGRLELPPIPPNGTLTKIMKTNRIRLETPAVDDTVTLSIRITDLSTHSMELNKALIDEVLTNKSDAISEQRSGINFILSLITLIIVFITLLISLPEKRPIISALIIILVLVIAYLIYNGV